MLPPPAKEEKFSDEPLTPDELRALRKIILADDRARWFWSTLRIWVLWGGAVATAFAAVKQPLTDFLRGILK